MAKTTPLTHLLDEVAAGKVRPVYLVSGDLVLAGAEAQRLAEALAERAGCEVASHRRPPRLGPILADLRTYSLFDAAKVALVTDSALFADRRAAAELLDQAAEALPVDGAEAELDRGRRAGAARLLQALGIFGIDASGDAERAVGQLPKWALQGGRRYRKAHPRGRSPKAVNELREGLATLLAAAQNQELAAVAEGDLAELGEVLANGLPEGYSLVLAEDAVAEDHPLVQALKKQGALVTVGRVTAGRGGDWQGLDGIADELARETGTKIAPAALQELARRTLRQTGEWKKRRVDAESTARLAGEYRKLASLSGDGQITRAMVEESVEDRGEEDVWAIFDALGAGRGGEALGRYRRLLGAADDEIAARLSFFALLAGFCRQILAVAGVARLKKVPAGVRNYNQFKSRWAPELQSELPGGQKSPLAGLHAYRLYKTYLAASSIDRAVIPHLPWWVLETEQQVKGESSEPDVAVTRLIARLAAALGG